jgi:enoyl-CoA hydratase/carnithine racemase
VAEAGRYPARPGGPDPARRGRHRPAPFRVEDDLLSGKVLTAAEAVDYGLITGIVKR